MYKGIIITVLEQCTL